MRDKFHTSERNALRGDSSEGNGVFALLCGIPVVLSYKPLQRLARGYGEALNTGGTD